MKKISRRSFIKWVTLSTGVFFTVIWDKMVSRQGMIKIHKKILLPYNSNKKVTFYHNFIVVNQKNGPEALSSHCTHLGCIINREENGVLVCPCHGSEFSLTGKVVRGPADKPLPHYPASITPNKKEILIES